MQEKNFAAYEYTTRTVQAKDQTRAADLYEAFGWEITESTPAASPLKLTLSMKRDRKLKHKQELIKLERQAENLFSLINRLEKSKTKSASVFSFIFGSVATLIFGGGMCLVMLVSGSVPAMVGGISLGLLGIALCGANYPIYKKLAEKKSARLMPVIDDNEEKLANILANGNELLSTDII